MFLLMTYVSLFANDYNDFQLYNSHKLNISNGLSHNGVTASIRDSRGYLWICTYDGLNQYNGFNVKTYKNTLSENLFNSNRIRCIAEDSNGRLWIGTDGGIAIFDYEKYEFRSLPVHNNVLSKSKSNFIIRQILFDKSRNTMICLSESDGIFEYSMDLSLSSYITYPKKIETNNLCKIDKKNYMISTNEGLLCYNIDNKECSFINNDIINNPSCIRTFKKNEVYISNGSNIYNVVPVFENGVISSINIIKELNTEYSIKTFEIEDSGRIWVGTVNNGVSVYSSFNNSTILMRLLEYKRISEVLFLADGNYYISTFDVGVYCYTIKDKMFNKLTFNGLKLPQILKYKKDCLLIKNNRKLYCYNLSQNKLTDFVIKNNKALQNDIKSICTDSFGTLWILTKKNHLLSYDESYNIKEYDDVKLLLLKNDVPQIFISDPFGNLWLGYSDNLYRVSFSPDKKIKEVESIHQNAIFDSCGISKVRSIYWDNKTSSLLVGTDVQGLYKLSIDSHKPIKDINIEHYVYDRNDKYSLSSNFVSCITRDNNGILWIGTEQGGLCKVIEDERKRMKFISFSEDNGLSNNVVKSLQCDKYGNLWVATNIGLNVYKNDNETFHVYRVSDGLPFDDFWYTSTQMDDGTLFFSNVEGLCYFNPDILPNDEQLPKLHIRSFSIHNNRILPNKEFNDRIIIESRISNNDILNLKYNENNISFDIDAIYSSAATDHYIKFKLEPISNEWIYVPAKEQKISFNGLQPDKYKLLLSASNSFGELTEPLSVNIRISPPFSRSVIAYILYFTLSIVIISLVVYNMLRVQKLKYELQAESIQKRSLELLNIEKQRFFSNISHELKTPLTLILAPISVLSERFSLDADVNDKLGIIKRQAKKMLQLIELSHELQLNERNMLKVKPCAFSFNKFLKDITSDFMFMAKYDKKNFIVNNIDKNINVYADYSMIEQIMNNLLTNSFKHTVQGDKISVDVFYHEQLLTIRVYDTGCGISDKDLPHIFDRFYQASNQGMKNIGGTGIGLAFTKRLIELHSGCVNVESKVGEGSAFTVSMPIIQNISELETNYESDELNNEGMLCIGDWDVRSIDIDSKFMHSRVYLVEDNSEMRSFMTDIIGQFFKVRSFANGKECLDGMTDEWPDIIVSDVMMPEMDGNELCNIIKSDLRTSHIPVILLTACNTVDDKIKGLEAGADAYISKPFYPKHVLTRICMLLENRSKLWERFESGVPLTINSKDNDVSAKDNEFICSLYEKFNEYLDNEEVDMELLAKEMGINRSLFFQKVKVLTDNSPYELLKSYRLQKAAEFLLKDEYNVNEVCMMTGFKSRTHFSRLFKEKYGVSPSKYKESMTSAS